MKDENVKQPIFLHGMWRSGSTYIWSQFRRQPGTYCYYEPLHQGLGRLTKARITRDTPEITKDNRHPVLETPYFTEFLPLLKRRGVLGYKNKFPYNPYILSKYDKDKALYNYLNKLISHAKRQKKQAVLGFNRTGLRISWIAENFEGTNIYIDRHPRKIWRSYKRHMDEGNYTYFTSWLITLEKNVKHPLLKPLCERLPLREGPQKLFQKPKAYYRKVLESMSAEETYALVFYMWIACALHGLGYSDIVLDMDRLPEKDYQAHCIKLIEEKCGLEIDFSDIRETGGNDNAIDYRTVEEAATQHFQAVDFNREAVKAKISSLVPEKQELLGKIIRRKDGGPGGI